MANPDAGDLKHLTSVRDMLLRLHKALLDAQRTRYERTNGPVASPGQFLQLVISDPAFDWLHRFSELIVEIDEATDPRATPVTAAQVQALLAQSHKLAHAENAHLADTLKVDARAAAMHQELVQLLPARPN